MREHQLMADCVIFEAKMQANHTAPLDYQDDVLDLLQQHFGLQGSPCL